MVHINNLYRIVVAAIVLTVIPVWPGMAQPPDAADKALAAYHKARETERTAFRLYEEAIKVEEKAQDRLKTASKHDKAYEAAFDKFERAETAVLKATTQLHKVEIKATILRLEEKKKRAVWDEMNRIKQYLPTEDLQTLRFLDRRLRQIGRSYNSLGARKAELEARLGFHGTGRSLWGSLEAAWDDLVQALSRVETGPLVTALTVAQVKTIYAREKFEDARKAVYAAFDRYLAATKGSTPPYVKSVKVIRKGKILLDATWKDKGRDGYTQRQLDAIAEMLRRQVAEADGMIEKLEIRHERIKREFDDMRDVREKLEDEYRSMLSIAHQAHVDKLLINATIDISVVLAEVFLTGGTAAVAGWVAEQGMGLAQKAFRASERRAIRQAARQIGTAVWAESEARVIAQELRQQERLMLREVREEIVGKEKKLAYRKLRQMFPAAPAKNLLEEAEKIAARAGKKFDSSINKAARSGSGAEAAEAMRNLAGRWKEWEKGLAPEMASILTPAGRDIVKESVAPALTMVGVRKLIVGGFPDLDFGDGTAYVTKFPGLADLLPETWGDVALGLGGDGIELVFDRVMHVAATGGVKLLERQGRVAPKILRAMAYQSLKEGPFTPRVTDAFSVIGAAAKAIVTGIEADVENRAMRVILVNNAMSKVLANLYEANAREQQKVLSSLSILHMVKTQFEISHDVILPPEIRELVANAPSVALRDFPADLEIEVEYSTHVVPGERSKVGNVTIDWDGRSDGKEAKLWRGHVRDLRWHPSQDGSGNSKIDKAARFKIELDAQDLRDRSLDSAPDTPVWRSIKDLHWLKYQPGVDSENYEILIEPPPLTKLKATYPNANSAQLDIR